ncbi:tigger transposable element-derived protein 6-like [Macrosteles quadrilineatus]|uniref:tigger transposable element-derived protein 6-like n=1 Tax=Macrosteles quadrilineatus TaxID=74068 RepID=UPI0023E34D78|nr:tigger transposable element-derived protein 6-like [Macrosteles quadrilineatus]
MSENNKKKRCALSVDTKRKIIKCVEENPTKKKTEIAKEFGIPPSTLATILKRKDKFDNDDLCSAIKKLKSCELKDVEECVLKWLKQCRDKNIAVSGPILQEKAQQFASELGHEQFRASNGWLQNFKKRNEIIFRKICGESAKVDDSVCSEWKDKLIALTEGYEPENIYNADETGLFFKCLPDKTLSFKGDKCHGGKSSKDRLTVMLCANCTGTDKLKPLVIGKSKNPRCFKNLTDLPTDYMANPKAWMNCEAFTKWLQSVNKEMKKKKKKILMFVDNCTAHGDIPKLSNIKIEFLPPNTTSKLQPLDQGIIQSFKVNYRKEVVQQFLRDMESRIPTNINILDAMWMTTKAWSKVTETTISNCFRKSGFAVPTSEDNTAQPFTQAVDVPESWEQIQEVLNLQEDAAGFEDFVTFDDDLAVCGELTDAEIISSVTSDENADVADVEEDNDEDEQTELPDPTSKEAHQALSLLKRFFLKKSGLSDGVVKSITDLDCALDTLSITARKQTTITDFFFNNQSGSSQVSEVTDNAN